MSYPRSIDEYSDGEIIEEITSRMRERKIDFAKWRVQAQNNHNSRVVSARRMKARLPTELVDAELDQFHKCEHNEESWKSLGEDKGDECSECGARTFYCHGCSEDGPVFHSGKICKL